MWLDTSAPLILANEGYDLGSEADPIPSVGEVGV